MTLLMMDMVMERGAWSEVRCQSGWMECWLMLFDPYQKNIRSMVEFDSLTSHHITSSI